MSFAYYLAAARHRLPLIIAILILVVAPAALLLWRYWKVILPFAFIAILIAVMVGLLRTWFGPRPRRDGGFSAGGGPTYPPGPDMSRKGDGTRYWSSAAGKEWARSRRDPLDKPPKK